MKPFMAVGPEKACADYASDVAKKNNWHFVSLSSKDFKSFEKRFYTSSLDEYSSLFYISECDELPVSESQLLIDTIRASPHKFILSCRTLPNWVYKKHCLIIPLAKDIVPEITLYLQTLLGEKDRDSARIALQLSDPTHLFHILKYGAYSNNESMNALLRISRNINKVHKSYLLSMLCYALPPKLIRTFYRKPSVTPLQNSIMKKLKKLYPRYNSSELADIYLNLAFLDSQDLDLSDEEKEFLHIQKVSVGEEDTAVFVKTASIEDYL